MRQPLPLAAASQDAAEQMLCILANIFHVFGNLDTLDTEVVRDRLNKEWLYRNAGELLSVIFLLRESNFQVHAVGKTDIRSRMEQWLGTETMKWFAHRLTETPRYATINDVDILLDEGCAIIVPTSFTLIVGNELPVIYNPAKDGHIVPYENSNALEHHWDIRRGIIAVHPS